MAGRLGSRIWGATPTPATKYVTLYVPIVTRQRLSDAENIDRVVKEDQSSVDAEKKYLHLKPFPKCSTEIF